MHIAHRHAWNLTPRQAIELQKQMAGDTITDRPLDLSRIRLVAGVDVSVRNNVSRAAVVVLTYPGMELVETITAQQPTPFPYIPGLLSFREGPVLMEAFEQVHNEPDVFIFDGMGIMHPRRLGIAAHMGLWLQRPTVGCGKSHLVGTYDPPDNEKGAMSAVMYHGQQLGVVLRTRINVKPVYISSGHLIDLASAVKLILYTTPKYRLPEPIRQAHNTAGKF